MKAAKARPGFTDQWLVEAHQGRPELELSPQWQRDLMREVMRRQARTGLGSAVNGYTAAFTGLLFRFAGAGALVALGLLLYARFFAPDLDAQAAGLMIEQPVGLAFLENWLWS